MYKEINFKEFYKIIAGRNFAECDPDTFLDEIEVSLFTIKALYNIY
jgi:hypothetical protein